MPEPFGASALSDVLLSAAESLAEAGSTHQVADTLLNAALHATPGRSGATLLLGDTLSVAGVTGTPVVMEHALPPGAAPLARAALDTREAQFATLHGPAAPGTPASHAAFPLMAGGRTLGVLRVDLLDLHVFTSAEQAFLRTLARHGALALDRANARTALEARVTQRTQELQTQNAAQDAFVTFMEAAAEATDVTELAERAVAVLHVTLGVAAAFYDLRGGAWHLQAASPDVHADTVALGRLGVPPDTPGFAQAEPGAAPVIVEGARPNAEGAWPYHAAAFAAYARGGQTWGLLSLGTSRAPQWTAREQAVFRAVARSLDLALERQATTERLRVQNTELDVRARALEAFVRLTQDLTLRGDPVALVQRAQAAVLSLLPGGYARYWTRDADTWRVQAHAGDAPGAGAHVLTHEDLPVGAAGPLDEVWASRTALYQDAPGQGARVSATLPVLVNDEVAGVLCIELRAQRHWTQTDRVVLDVVTRSLSLALEGLEAQRTLASTQRYLKTVADHAPLVLFATDARGVFTLLEGQLLPTLGLQPGQGVGRPAMSLFAHEPELRQRVRLHQALNGELTHDLLAFRSGRVLETWLVPVHGPDGTVNNVVGVALDATERLQALREAERTNEELRRSNAELEQFAYVASHDLQEPLRTVTSFAQRLVTRYAPADDERATQYARFILEGTARMSQLIQDLLAFSRVTRNPDGPQRVPMDDLMLQVQQDLRAQIEACDADIHVGALPDVHGDATQLRQLLQNLVGNALKFRAHDRRPEVHVHAQPAGSMWRFTVRDNGIGIEEVYFQRIFEIFQRLHHREQYPGSGIGLSIARKIVERHGGDITLTSRLGVGTTFAFTLPLAPADHDHA
ncbi:ATP-binding protein [Deinococcus maricopensis]|uniref:histidine kinase n=1 Tax=Deinococcus maricopensis (strain DSM 21211 / LMG 22137 / NRRL B-23946 / LB-34) TaxID=709986 RepID=E8U4B5_DEIML|nr:ATP-binding protein [Deinococcus maricopensis]ADV65952.1 multi-sensor signal transduction histidine kinase [Deinococcus maricopensis DSM 21211]